MTERSHVPKFGNWEGEENVPYTAYFEKARKGRSGAHKMINPNDPEENPDFAPGSRGGDHLPEEPTVHQKATKTSHESDLKMFANSPARHENTNRRAAGREFGRQGPPSVDQSPLHPRARTPGRGPGPVGAPSPSWEGGKGSYESSHGTPSRSRLKPKGNESPDTGAAVPKFGEWDENNPSSADEYSYIFNQVREERQVGAGRVPGIPSESPYRGTRRPSSSSSSKSCCFPWGRK